MGTASFGRALAKRVLGAFGVKNTAYTNTIEIGGTSSPTDNKATWSYGFPSKTMMPVDTTNPSEGGIPPNGKDMNGVLNSISAECENSMNGILPNEWIAPNVWTSVDSTWKGYPQGAVVLYPTGATATKKKLYQSTVNNNLDTPSASSKWIALEPESRFQIWTSGNFNGNAYRSWSLPFTISTNGVPLSNVSISVYGTVDNSSTWQTMYQACSFQDDALRRTNNGFSIQTSGSSTLIWRNGWGYGMWGFFGESCHFSRITVKIVVQKFN